MEMTRCMLYEKEMPKKLWAEAANTTVFFVEQAANKGFAEKKTPFEVWFGYKPNLQNLKAFGCLCFSYMPQVTSKERQTR